MKSNDLSANGSSVGEGCSYSSDEPHDLIIARDGSHPTAREKLLPANSISSPCPQPTSSHVSFDESKLRPARKSRITIHFLRWKKAGSPANPSRIGSRSKS